MTPEISEFSYGFALTHEMMGRLGPLRAAPIFPSLIEEGREGGGYDVHLDAPGVMMYLQFKRADCMVRRNAGEIRDGLPLQLPFYRLKLTERWRSAQHDLLLELDVGNNEVFYTAPRFHTPTELNNAWLNGAVEDRSFFIRPRDIGNLDLESHHVAFDDFNHFVCSEPRPVKGFVGLELDEYLLERLQFDHRPLREGPIDEALRDAKTAQLRAREKHIETPSAEEVRWRADGVSEFRADRLAIQDKITDEPSRPRRPTKREPLPAPREPRSEEESQLRDLADLSLRTFGTQLFVIQGQ